MDRFTGHVDRPSAGEGYALDLLGESTKGVGDDA